MSKPCRTRLPRPTQSSRRHRATPMQRSRSTSRIFLHAPVAISDRACSSAQRPSRPREGPAAAVQAESAHAGRRRSRHHGRRAQGSGCVNPDSFLQTQQAPLEHPNCNSFGIVNHGLNPVLPLAGPGDQSLQIESRGVMLWKSVPPNAIAVGECSSVPSIRTPGTTSRNLADSKLFAVTSSGVPSARTHGGPAVSKREIADAVEVGSSALNVPDRGSAGSRRSSTAVVTIEQRAGCWATPIVIVGVC